MASKHGPHHRWNADRARCLDCGRDAEDIADELQQQLAQAREALAKEEKEHELACQEWERDLKDWRASYDELKIENAQARALLEELAPIRGRYTLEAFALVQEKIRAFLAAQKEPQP